GYWAEHDLKLRERLGFSVDPRKERQLRRADQEKLARALEREGLDRSALSAHRFIARTPCKIALEQPEDVLELLEQANLPGSVDQHPNWRRKLPLALEAWHGSTHGYDIVDHNAVNPEIGTERELNLLVQTLREHGMGLVPDLVPNHMGVLHADNAWWLDVLEKGRASQYARFFDIDWSRGKLLLPVLGKHYGEALEAGELKLENKGGRWSVRYFDHRFPLNPRTTGNLKPVKDPMALHRLLERQHYRLAYWRVASDEINYPRFFEITDLAGIRVEDRTVFEATHGLICRLARRGSIDGLRIDHPDGLADPQEYLERLNETFARPWIVVEKILADYEHLQEDWPIHGTTGYRFVNVLSGVF